MRCHAEAGFLVSESLARVFNVLRSTCREPKKTSSGIFLQPIRGTLYCRHWQMECSARKKSSISFPPQENYSKIKSREIRAS
jgi:hypothetical protein